MLIAQLSDLHCGSPHFVEELLTEAIDEVNGLEPDVVVLSGDLTNDGFRSEYEMAREFTDRIHCRQPIVIPGNHDARNVGYLHFEEMFGERFCVEHRDGVSIVAVDSSEPDLDSGTIGRGRYPWIRESFAPDADLRIFILHHHLLPIPGTGRERNIVSDAGDALECLVQAEVNLVLCGHKHVPYAWKLDDLFVVNAGTVSSLKLRGNTQPCYNLVEIEPDRVQVHRRFPGKGQELILEFSPRTREFQKHTAVVEHQIGAP